MNPRLRLPIAIAGFAVSVVVGVLVGRAVDGPPAATSVSLPAVIGEDQPAVSPVAVIGDFDEFAESYLAAIEEARESASGDGVRVGSGSASVGSYRDFADDTGATTATTLVDPATEGPASSSPPADDAMFDICADGGDTCPPGVGGTILLAIRDVPFEGFADIPTAPPGSGSPPWHAECEPSDTGVVVGIATSRPAVINFEYRAGRWLGSDFEVHDSVTFTTPDSAETVWNEWIADDTADDRDPRRWIRQCFTLPDLPVRTDYLGFVTYTDKYNPEVTVANNPSALRFVVLGRGGMAPGAQRRPTFALGYGIDDLRVGLTRTPQQRVEMVAIPTTDPGACDTGGDPRSAVFDIEGAVSGRVIAETDIPADVLEAAGYLYFRDHSKSVVYSVGLREGTDYVLCIYWIGEGPSFDRAQIQIAEAIAVSTPEAYHPRLILHNVTNTFGEIDSVSVQVYGCSAVTVALVNGRDGRRVMADDPQEICTLDDNLTKRDRGIRMQNSVAYADGSTPTNFPFIRTDLRCDTSPCLLRLDELAVVPLPMVPTERRLCGTGFGSGCDGEIPMRSAGDAVVKIVYVNTVGNGLTEWSIGVADEFDNTPATLPETPRLDVSVNYEISPATRDPGNGAVAHVTVTADRPVGVNAAILATNSVGAPACTVGGTPAYSNGALAEVHTFTLLGLCLGSRYSFEVVAVDGSGNTAVIIGRFGELGQVMELNVPPVYGAFEMSATVVVPEGRKFVDVSPIRVHPVDVYPPYAGNLEWILAADTVAANRRAGWVPYSTYDRASGCAVSGVGGPFLADNRVRRSVLVGQENVELRIEVGVVDLFPVGGIYGECARRADVTTTTVQATVSLVDLREGVTLTSDDGSVTVTIQMVGWRAELVG